LTPATAGDDVTLTGNFQSKKLVVNTNSDTDGQVAASFYGANGSNNRGLEIKLGVAGGSVDNGLVTLDAKQAAQGTLAFATKGTEKMRLSENGTLFFDGINTNTSNIVLAGSNGQAIFSGPVSIGGKAAANTIEEYEEGTTTIDLTVGGSAAGLTGTNAQGTYTRIGDLVMVQINLNISSASVSGKTGDLVITGLPFPAENNTRSNYFASVCSITNWATDYKNGSKTIVATGAANSTNLVLFAGSRNSAQLDESAFNFGSGNCKLSTTFTYRIA